MPNAKWSRKWWYETILTLVRCSGFFFWCDENLNKFQNYLSSVLSLTWELNEWTPTGYVRNSNLFMLLFSLHLGSKVTRPVGEITISTPWGYFLSGTTASLHSFLCTPVRFFGGMFDKITNNKHWSNTTGRSPGGIMILRRKSMLGRIIKMYQWTIVIANTNFGGQPPLPINSFWPRLFK